MVGDDWNEIVLGGLIDIKHGYAFKGQYFHDEPTKHVLLTPGNFAIGGGYKAEKLKYYDGPVPEEFVLRGGDLLITMTDLSKAADTLGYPALVPMEEYPQYLHNQRLGKVIIRNNSRIDKRFLYYLLCVRDYRDEIVAGATGTTVKHTSPERIKRYRTRIHAQLDEQHAIAHILGTLDDKIELNRRMNETLEAIARAIFKSWFIQYDPAHVKADRLIRDGCLEVGDGYRAKNSELGTPGLPFIRAADPQQAEDREQLRVLLAGRPSGGILFTTIQKFAPSKDEIRFPRLSDRTNIVVIADEAHRTQYGFRAVLDKKTGKYTYGFAKYLRDALPNATFVGFTGTPIETDDRDSRTVFGEYVSIYDIQDAVDDGADEWSNTAQGT